MAYPEILSDSQRRHHVVRIVAAYQPCVYLQVFLFQQYPEVRMAFITCQDFGSLVFFPVRDCLQVRTFRRHAAQFLVVNIQEYLVRCPLDVVVQFPFGLFHSLEAAESEQVSLAYIGYEPEVRKADGHEFLYVAGMACPHFYDGYFRLVIDFQEGKGYTYTVVQVSFRGSHIVAYGKDGLHQFFGRGLAVRPCQTDDCYGFSVYECHGSVPARKLLQCFQRVFRRNHSPVLSCRFRIPGNDGIGRSRFECLECVVVSVEVFPFQREKQFSAMYLPAVSGDSRAFPENIVKFLYCHCPVPIIFYLCFRIRLSRVPFRQVLPLRPIPHARDVR